MKPIYLCTLLALAATAHSQVAFSTFGPGDSYQLPIGWTIGSDSPHYSQGDQFSPTLGGNVSKIRLGFGEASSLPASYTVKLFSDAGGPGTELGSWDFTTQEFLGSDPTPLSIDVANGPLLEQGSNYWLLIDTADGNTGSGAWNFNDQGMIGNHIIYADGVFLSDDTQTMGAFEITVAPVPEPASLAILGIGALLIRRRKKS